MPTVRSMGFLNARRSGKCDNCQAPIAVDDRIFWNADSRKALCEGCSPDEAVVAAAPETVIHVAVSEDKREIGFRLEGRVDRARFNTMRSALGVCRFKDGTNFLPVNRAAGAIKALQDARFTLNLAPDVETVVQGIVESAKEAIVSATDRIAEVDRILRARGRSLYAYQIEGVRWLAPRRGALLMDDMGLGKTIQALTAAPEGAPMLVVCPAIAKGVWLEEAAKWRPDLKVTVLSGRNAFVRAPEPGEMMVINYDILSPTQEEVQKAQTKAEADLSLAFRQPTKEARLRAKQSLDKWSAMPLPVEFAPGTLVVADEIHKCANPKALRTLRLTEICETIRSNGGFCWGLTATPLKNRPQELWCVLRVLGIEREAFGSWKAFVSAYNGEMECVNRRKQIWVYKWGQPTEEAARFLQRVSLRREKQSILTDLPAKTYQTITIDVDRETIKQCDALLAKLIESLPARDRKDERDRDLPREQLIEKVVERILKNPAMSFTTFTAIRAKLAAAKVPTMLDIVETFEEQGTPLVVCSSFRAPIDLLGEREGWANITGDVPPEKRTEIVRRFQEGQLKGVAFTIKAGGEALTLTRAFTVLRIDRELTPAANIQAEDRVYRIGQANAVLVQDVVVNHPMDAVIARILAKKEQIISHGVNATAVTHVAPEPEIVIDWEAIEAQAMAAAREAQQAREAAGKAKNEHERKLAERKAEAAKKQVQGRVRAAAARRLGEQETDEDAPRRGPKNALEVWAHRGLQQLAEADPDRAQELNGEGYSKSDGGLGHALAWLKDFTEQEWRLVVRLARHYRRQLGDAPSAEEPLAGEP